MATAGSSTRKHNRLSDQVAGGMAYACAVPAVYFLISERYKRKPFVRFHSLQAIYFFIACILITVLLGVISNVVPSLQFLNFNHFPLDSLVLVIVWIVMLIKAFNGEWYKLPLIGAMAERRSQR